ncbi:hypothetical protein B7463_g6301, partial [Scytalidium lignicola]
MSLLSTPISADLGEDQVIEEQEEKNKNDKTFKNNVLKNNSLKNNSLSKKDSNKRDLNRRDLSRRDLSKRDLNRRDLSRRDLNRRDLSRRDLSRRDLSRRDLNRRDLSRRDLNSRDLNRRDLSRRDLNRRDLSRRDLSRRDSNKRDLNRRDLSRRDLNRRNSNRRDLQRRIIRDEQEDHIAYEKQEKSTRVELGKPTIEEGKLLRAQNLAKQLKERQARKLSSDQRQEELANSKTTAAENEPQNTAEQEVAGNLTHSMQPDTDSSAAKNSNSASASGKMPEHVAGPEEQIQADKPYPQNRTSSGDRGPDSSKHRTASKKLNFWKNSQAGEDSTDNELAARKEVHLKQYQKHAEKRAAKCNSKQDP